MRAAINVRKDRTIEEEVVSLHALSSSKLRPKANACGNRVVTDDADVEVDLRRVTPIVNALRVQSVAVVR